jgi:hypothetical protein
VETTQATAPASAQAQTPAHPIHTEQQTLEKLTQYVRDTPDNDPHAGTDLEAPAAEQAQTPDPEIKTEEPGEQVEFDEETPFFELDYKTESGVEKKKLSAKEIREGWLAKQDYHRNIQKVKQQEAEIQQKVQQAQSQAAQQFIQQIELHKQAIAKLAGVKSMPEIEALAKDDPAAAQQEFLRFINVNQQYQQLEAQQRAVAQKLQEQQQAALQQARLQARQTLEADIPGWNADLYNQTLATVVKEYGFKNEEVEPVVDARLIKLFHDATKYRQLQQAKPEVSKKVVAVPKVVKPGSGDKPNPASEAGQELMNKLKKTGDWRDAAQLYLTRQRSKK